MNMTHTIQNAISVKNLSKSFGSTLAVNDVSFDIPEGHITALLGGNGAGKTTTLTMLLGLMLPSEGHIHILGHNMITDRIAALPFMNFSSPYVDLPQRLSVQENLIVSGHLYGLMNLKARIEELVEDLHLGAFINRPHGSLSAGQKTRASLAKALLNKPRLLLLDEPTASLDPDTADWMRSLLIDYCKQTKATLFMASHNMIEVERMCNDVIIFKAGQIVDRNTPEKLLLAYGRKTLEDVFLDISRERMSANDL